MIRALLALLLSVSPAAAETVVAARTIRAQSVITVDDIIINEETTAAAIDAARAIIGMEARVALFVGRPILPGDVGQPAVVERNQIIPLLFEKNGLVISTDGRALGRAGPGEVIRVMNVGSRATVSAMIGNDGAAYVQR
ncbi:flagellar basal body P-ring formation chaperone FlgA [Roseobacter sp. CCS2]|uniref:flagellar basal body P-ring formation chaperone FlgA n=1 Tax=Roseobacter sp. CCS2 TaxID=391593 RepID=UPI0000F400D6|nr:flagellar basal body P-ring formation chaperone FlgA [Roseobacter sp. CCS2]EBA13838.1 putative flagellar basal-body P-ring formation protein FlgA [Roseobacter sp. CCS2]